MPPNELSRRKFLQASATGLAANYEVVALKLRGIAGEAKLQKTSQRPRLLFGPEDLPALRVRLSQTPSKQIYDRLVRAKDNSDSGAVAGSEAVSANSGNRSRREVPLHGLILSALLTGDRAMMEAAGKALVEATRGSKERGAAVFSGAVNRGHQGRPGATLRPNYDFSNLRYVHALMRQYDIVSSFGVLSDEDQMLFKDQIIWHIEQFMSPKIRAINSQHHDRLHNFHVDNVTSIATAAMCFPEHPDAQKWLKYALTDLAWQLEQGVTDGVWHESIRYHGHILSTLVPLAYMLNRNANFDLFRSEAFRSLLDWLVRCQTPADRVYGAHVTSRSHESDTLGYPGEAICLEPVVGDGTWQTKWVGALAWAAPAYEKTDPQFAGRLMWAWRRAGGPYEPATDILPLVLTDPAIKPIPQKLESDCAIKAGYAVMRSGYGQPDEKWLYFHCKPNRATHWANHNDKDLNSFSLYAYGVPLALDAGAAGYRTPAHGLWSRSTIAHNTVMFGGRDQALEDGEIVRWVSKPGADYVIGDPKLAVSVDPTIAMQFWRHILFVKPDYFIIWDFIRSYVPTDWLLHSLAQEIRKGDHVLEFITPWEVNLDVHFLLPKERIEVEEASGHVAASHLANTQKYIRVKNKPGQDFLTILHPRKANATKLTAELRGGEENVLEVKLGEQTDYIMLFPVNKEYRDSARDIAMSGRVGVVRSGPSGKSLILVEGTRLSHQGRVVNA